MNYQFNVSWPTDGSIIVIMNEKPIFQSKTTNDTMEIDVGGVKIKDLQMFSPDSVPNNVGEIKDNVSKLNNEFNNKFTNDGVPFIEDFKNKYSNALNSVVTKGNSTSMDAALHYQSFIQFFYSFKRSIGIAYVILTMYETIAPEKSTEFKDLDAKEKYLRQFLTDSVGLILNTNEWIDNANQV